MYFAVGRLFQTEKGLKTLFLRLSRDKNKNVNLDEITLDNHMLRTHALVVMQVGIIKIKYVCLNYIIILI